MKMLGLQFLQYTGDRSVHPALTIELYYSTQIGASFLSAYLPAHQLAWIDEPHIALTQSDVVGGYWELTLLSTQYRCTMNGRSIPPHEKVLLSVADTIEIGFLVFKVAPPALHAQQAIVPLVDTEDPAQIVHDAATPESQEIQALLDVPLNSTEAQDNPFDILSEFAIADALVAGKPISTDDMIHGLDIKQTLTTMDHAHTVNKPLEADPSHTVRQENNKALAASTDALITPVKVEKQDVFVHLAADYNKVIDDPEYLYQMSLYNKEVVQQTGAKDNVDDLFDVKRKAVDFLTIEDQLMGNLQIDDILSTLGGGDMVDFMADNTTRVDVLHLFVDPYKRKTKPTTRIPATTLKDHHAMSLDSHLTPVGGRRPHTTSRHEDVLDANDTSYPNE